MQRAALAVLALCAPACASPEMRGAESAPPEREPKGRELARYRASDCRDAQGGRFDRVSAVRLLRDPEGGEFLVDAVPRYDSIVVRNRFEARGERVFQVILSDGEHKPLLLDYRLPRSGDGRMAAARWFAESETEEGAPRGRIVRIDFACRLVLAAAAGAPGEVTSPASVRQDAAQTDVQGQ